MIYQRLLHESTQLGAEKILGKLPADLQPALEQSVHQAVREAVVHYAEGMDTLSRQLNPIQHARSRV
jgi:hypothetical protein